jgi:1,2-diacylglycerol 3-alpha-glucosyltransferase
MRSCSARSERQWVGYEARVRSLNARVALLCSGLGNIHRGHEVFARSLFDLVRDSVDITLYKGGGEPSAREIVVPNIPRNAACLRDIHVVSSPRWIEGAREQERHRVEAVTFAYGALGSLLDGRFDVIHCLEDAVCEVIYTHRHLFVRTPRIVFSNGGALPRREIPPCDFVQEYTEHNWRFSDRKKAFVIPHGVDTAKFNPQVGTRWRESLGVPDDALLVISVGAIARSHKRMDYVIREIANVDGAFLLIAGQPGPETPEIEALGRSLMGERVKIVTVAHEELPQVYAAADVFTLGSLFETFGIVYIEAMATGLPVICTNHPNQVSIVREGIFIDVGKDGALSHVLSSNDRETFRRIGERARGIAESIYDERVLKYRYVEAYQRICALQPELPQWNWQRRIVANARNVVKIVQDAVLRRAE